MPKNLEIELLYQLPSIDTDPDDLSDAVFEAGFEDAVVGTGAPGLLAVHVDLSVKEDAADSDVLKAASAILSKLPKGSALREVGPDLVSLNQAASHLNISRQALQKRRMPPQTMSGLYRLAELTSLIKSEINSPASDKKIPKFADAFSQGLPWFEAGDVAAKINGALMAGIINQTTLRTKRSARGVTRKKSA